MEIPVLVRSLESSNLSSTSFDIDKTFWGEGSMLLLSIQGVKSAWLFRKTADFKMEIPVLVRSLKSSNLSSTSFDIDKTFWGEGSMLLSRRKAAWLLKKTGNSALRLTPEIIQIKTSKVTLWMSTIAAGNLRTLVTMIKFGFFQCNECYSQFCMIINLKN